MSELDSVSFTGVSMMSFSLVPPSQPSPELGDILRDHRAVLLHDSLVLFTDVVTNLPETPEVTQNSLDPLPFDSSTNNQPKCDIHIRNGCVKLRRREREG